MQISERHRDAMAQLNENYELVWQLFWQHHEYEAAEALQQAVFEAGKTYNKLRELGAEK